MVTAAFAPPRVQLVPEADRSLAEEAIEFCRSVGLDLDPWQRLVLDGALGVDARGRWVARDIGLIVPRQNGKSAILEARVLYGLYVLAEPLILWTSHQRDTSLEIFRRMLALIEESPDLAGRVKRVIRSHGEEGFELDDGSRVRFRTRTGKSARGFTCDTLILDEAHYTDADALNALAPTLATRHSQTWYAGSAVDQQAHEHGVVLARVRERGHGGESRRLAFFEWSADLHDEDGTELKPDRVYDELVDDEDLWYAANPALGARIPVDNVRAERETMDPRGWLVERLGIGDWPRTDAIVSSPVPPERWLELVDPTSEMVGQVVFAFDVSPERRAAIAAAGKRDDGRLNVEIIRAKAGTGWLLEWLERLAARDDCEAILVDSYGPAGSVVTTLEDADIDITTVTAGEHAMACGRLLDLVGEDQVRHRGTPEVVAALRGARPRPLGDAWAWSRKNSSVDISSLVAITLALWRAADLEAEPWEPQVF